MNRRHFLGRGAAAAALSAVPAVAARPSSSTSTQRGRRAFKLRYAPHFGMFRHHAGDDLLDQLSFMHDEGFTALEDNGMKGRPVEVQEKIARRMEQLGMTMGVFVAHADFRRVTFGSDDPAMRDRIRREMEEAVEVAKRVNARWCTVVPGTIDQRLQPEYQTANVIENLRYAAEICEKAGLVMVLEALNPWRDHPGLFLTKIPQAYLICRAVDSPSCKILDDLYHQQVTEGDLIRNLERSWSEIAYFQVGDHPGRKEPGTGEINYLKVFSRIHARGYEGIVGMEHGNSRSGKEGERAVIEAYRAADAF